MSETVNGNVYRDEDITLKELILKFQRWWRFILSKWVIIIISTIIGGVLGAVYAFSKKPIYKAELKFIVQDGKSNGSSNLASQFGLNVNNNGSNEFSSENILELMKSRSVVEKALLKPVSIKGKTETLADFYIDINELRKSWSKDPNLANVHFFPGIDRSKFTLSQDSLLGVFYNDLVQNYITFDGADGGASIMTLDVASCNELFAKNFSEALVKIISEFYVQSKTKKDVENIVILQRQADSVRRLLNSAISGVALSSDFNPNPNPLLQSLRIPSQRKQIDVQANSAIFIDLIRDLGAAKATLLQKTPLIQIVDAPILPLEKKTYSKRNTIIAGCLIGLFLMIILLSVRKTLNEIMA